MSETDENRGMDLATFLLARIADDEAVALEASWRFSERTTASSAAEHIARWDPARVLVECDAKRRIVAEAQDALAVGRHMIADDVWSGRENAYEEVLQFLAMPYADHSDYRDEWRP